MTISLIIATYNWPEALFLSLKSVQNQIVLPTEILIADDGSDQRTQKIIEDFRQSSKIPIHHIWQEDNGFRLAKIRNKAIFAAKSDYIIQIDGDIILNKNYVRDQIAVAKIGTFVTGSRVFMLKEKSTEILKTKQISFSFFERKIKNRLNGLHFPFINLFIKPKNKPYNKLIFKVRGCNMCFWRKDLIEINGYDEQFAGWGREDSELALRLFKKGLSLKKLRFAGIQYHIFHNEQTKDNLESNNKLLEMSQNNNAFWCLDGILKK